MKLILRTQINKIIFILIFLLFLNILFYFDYEFKISNKNSVYSNKIFWNSKKEEVNKKRLFCMILTHPQNLKNEKVD